MPYYNRTNYYPQQQIQRSPYDNVNNILYNVGVPAVLGLALGPLWGIGAALLSANNSTNTNIININTRRNNGCDYNGF